MTRTLSLGIVVALCSTWMGCSVVLSTSRRQGEAADGALPDAGVDGASERDTGPRPDGSPEIDAGHDAARPDTGVDAGPEEDAGVDASSDPDAGSDGGSDAGPTCGTGTTCVPAAPGGWLGPVIFVTSTGSTAPLCPSDAPSTAFATHSGMDADAASCGCSCAAPPSELLSCSSATLSTGSSCVAGVPSTYGSFAPGECRYVGSLPTSGVFFMSRPTFSAGGATCAPSPSVTVPPITWEQSHRACGFGAPTSCGSSSVCAPTRSAGERLCVYADGAATCPSGFPDAITTSESATDTRGCGPCTCGATTGSCSGSLQILSACGSGGSVIMHGQVPVGGCTAAINGSSRYGSAFYTANGSCPPSTPSATGTATPTAVRTVCCAAD